MTMSDPKVTVTDDVLLGALITEAQQRDFIESQNNKKRLTTPMQSLVFDEEPCLHCGG